MEILRWPPVLVLSLKRWTWSRVDGAPDKIDRHVSFETMLPVAPGTQYHLRSVVVHTGPVGGGHYTSYVRGSDNYWYFCDDSSDPRRCPTEEVLRAQAYMLFYET